MSDSGTNSTYKIEDFCHLTLDECERVFDEIIKANPLSEHKDKKLNLLRSSCELLIRLEDTPYSHFAGRLLIFLAKQLPFTDQSGTNLKSEFHLRDVAPKTVNVSEPERFNMEEGELDSNETPDDEDTFHLRFWKVQSVLGNPNLLWDKNVCTGFKFNVDYILSYIEKTPTTQSVWRLNRNYSDCPRALALQIKDINMRRCFLLQLLIIIQYLELPVENISLGKSQTTWLQATTTKIYSIIGCKDFSSFVQQVLRNELHWVKWKNSKCPEPPKPEEDDFVNMRATYHKKRKLSDELTNAQAYNLQLIGSQEMTKLWNKNQEKFEKPDLATYIKSQQDIQDPNTTFRILRMGRKNRHFLRQTGATISPIEEYLKEFVSRVN